MLKTTTQWMDFKLSFDCSLTNGYVSQDKCLCVPDVPALAYMAAMKVRMRTCVCGSQIDDIGCPLYSVNKERKRQERERCTSAF